LPEQGILLNNNSRGGPCKEKHNISGCRNSRGILVDLAEHWQCPIQQRN
jgi:hypothetical protein